MIASTLPPKAKRLRAGKSKSRNGCSTCKIRRVKCDEGKPICARCQKFGIGHKCSYPREENLRNKKLPLLHPRPESLHPANDTLHLSTWLPQLIARNPSASVPGDEEERRYFELFREKVAHVICGYFETPFWTRLMPQMCHHEPAIRHEIVALSALFKSSTHEEDEQSGKDDHRKLAFLHQSKALSYLRASFSGDSQNVRLALITSLLFGCFENKYGNWQTATHQIYTAKRLLKEWRTARNSSGFTVTNYMQMPPVIDPEIAPALGRLEMHLMSLLFMNPVYSPPFAEDYDGVNECFANMPNRFNSLETACPYAFQIAILGLKAYSKSVRYNTRIMFSHFPTALEREQTKLREDRELWGKVITRWYAAFGPLFHDQDLEVTTMENLGILQCYVSVLAFDTILDASMKTEECVFDKFLERFQYIINSSRFLFQKDQDFRLLGQPMLHFGTGLIMFLFYAATRCRDSTLRREAIAILREYQFRNGVWDSLVAAEVANWVADLEEEGRDKEGLVPERARVRMHTLKATVDGGVVNVECLQGVVGDGLRSRRATLSLRPLVFVHSELGKKL